jgi:SAM-dependent methyltransferase
MAQPTKIIRFSAYFSRIHSVLQLYYIRTYIPAFSRGWADLGRQGRDAMWDERYAGDAYLFGTEPAAFLVRQAGLLPQAARVLMLAEGEGRNAVWLAEQGHEVTGIDQSAVGLAKAARLARERGVQATFRQGDVLDWDGADGPWDAVVAIFVHFRSAEWAGLARALLRGLRPGGLFLYHGYGPGQIAFGTGGPREPGMLPTAAEVTAHFPGWTRALLRDHDDVLAEGTRHIGRSALVDVVLRAPGVADRGAAA